MVTRNKLTPLLWLLGLAILGTIIYQGFSGSGVKPAKPLTEIPTPAPDKKLPTGRAADADNISETLATVVASNADLRRQVSRIVEANNRLIADNERLYQATGMTPTATHASMEDAASAPLTVTPAPVSATAPPAPEQLKRSPGALDNIGNAVGQASETVQGLMGSFASGKAKPAAQINSAADEINAQDSQASHLAGAVSYRWLLPMGYAAVTQEQRSSDGQKINQTRFVRTMASDSDLAAPSAATAAQVAAVEPQDEPFFTIPENATLVGVKTLTSLIGRVPIDGRVTDPMQFKAMVGRDNLAANGQELPDDLAGMIVTGVAIGDMALSCSEGKIHSVTFVFNDGTIRTISSRNKGSSNSAAGSGAELGFISDVHGNPCIAGKFVTNAPAYLTDIVTFKSLGVAAAAYAQAQTTLTQRTDGSSSTQVTGDRGKYVMGQAAMGAADEVSSWLLSRLKNSFDAVVTQSGQEVVIHIDRELRLDKAAKARKLVHQWQYSQTNQAGAHYGLD